MEEKSKLLSYLLRHKPEAKNLTIDKEGWVNISELVSNAGFTREDLELITKEDEKGRYTIAGEKIRANQGHSTSKVKLTFGVSIPPTVLFHGTSLKVLDAIKKSGLLPMTRQYVHLSSDLETAKSVAGRRKSETVLFYVDAKQMLTDGIKFFKSENGVWLVEAVPPKYLKQMEKVNDDK